MGDSEYFEDYTTFISMGRDTSMVNSLYLLPTYENPEGELWIRIKYSYLQVQSLPLSVNLQLHFNYDSNYICSVNYLSRECGGVVLYANISNPAMMTQSLQFKQYSKNATYLMSVSLL